MNAFELPDRSEWMQAVASRDTPFNDELLERDRQVAIAALEWAARAVESEHVGESVDDVCDNRYDEAYNTALRHAAEALRAQAEKLK